MSARNWGRATRALCCLQLLCAMTGVALSADLTADERRLVASLVAADEAARSFDYEKAIKLLEEAQPWATPAVLENIRRRMAFYETLLGMSAVVAIARQNPYSLVGHATLRDGKTLMGRIQLLELGVSPSARIGNRIIGRGALQVKPEKGAPISIPADEVAMVNIKWAPPPVSGAPSYWHIAEIEVITQSGESVVGTPTWCLPVSSLGIRKPGDDRDTRVDAYPFFGKDFDPSTLTRQLVIVGAPGALPEAPRRR